jgi:hypothetical protein
VEKGKGKGELKVKWNGSGKAGRDEERESGRWSEDWLSRTVVYCMYGYVCVCTWDLVAQKGLPFSRMYFSLVSGSLCCTRARGSFFLMVVFASSRSRVP